MSKLITVWGSPGSGKTTTAIKLAVALAHERQNVVLIHSDVLAPTLPYVLKTKKPIEKSLGSLLAAPVLTKEDVLKTAIRVDNQPYMMLLGYKAEENYFSYPIYDRSRVVELFALLRTMADIIIIDGMSHVKDSLLTTVALECSDLVYRTAACDLKSMSYFMSVEPMLPVDRYKRDIQRHVLIETSPHQIGDEVGYVYQQPRVIPYTASVEHQGATYQLFESSSSKDMRMYLATLMQMKDEVMQLATS